MKSINTLARITCIIGLFTLAVTAAHAQVVFTIHATSTSTNLGYTNGQALTFTLTLNTNPVNSDYVNPYQIYISWFEELTTDTEIFTNVTGTGLVGTWTRPTAILQSPWTTVYDRNDHQLLIGVGSDLGSNGLTVAGHTPNAMHFYATYPTLSTAMFFSDNIPPADANAFFTSLAGTYVPSNTIVGDITTYAIPGAAGTATFTINDLTISGGAVVPEPSTYAAICGALALGFAAYKRRRAT